MKKRFICATMLSVKRCNLQEGENMALQFVFGNSGSGKSYYLSEYVVREAMNNPDKEYLYIVPEQFTLQKQKDVIKAHPNNVIMNIDVCSFNRLAYRIFEELGIKEQVILEDIGKSMVIRKLIEENKEDLELFHSSIHRDGFVEEIKSIISEFCQYNVELQQLEGFRNNNNLGIHFAEKFTEVTKLYGLFREYLKGRYITSEEILDILRDNADKSKILKDCVIVLDEFTGFTPVQYNLILSLLKVCERMLVAVTVDVDEVSRIEDIQGQTLFRMSSKTVCSLKKLAAEGNIEICENILINGEGRFADNSQLKHLERYIFRYPYKVYETTQEENVFIYYGKDITMECEFVANKIKEMVANNGYRYRDFAILCGELKEYGRCLSKIFDREGMPCFYDMRKHISGNPFVEMISAILDIANSDFSYEAIFRYLRCGMSDIPADECDLLDNYLYATGIKGYRFWKRDFARKCTQPYLINLDEVNEIRKKVLGEIEEVIKALKNVDDAGRFTQILYDFCLERKCEEKLCVLSDEFEKSAKMLKAKEYIQVYPAIMTVFEKIMELISDSKMSLVEYAKIFETGSEEVKVGLIPLGVDQVLIGDINRSRVNNAKVVFLVGVNEGIIPKKISSGGIISEVEREMMLSQGICLANPKTEEVFDQQYYLYLALTKASHKLYLTYSGMGTDGKPRRKSDLIGKVSALFRNLDTSIIVPDSLTWKKDGLDYLIDGLKEGCEDAEWMEVLKWNLSDKARADRLNKLLGVIYNKKDKSISAKLARSIFEKNTYSVSKIQTYCSCGYSYFLKYGLNVRPKRQAELSAIDMGVIYHDALNRYSVSVAENGWGFDTINKKTQKKLVEICVDDAVAMVMDEQMQEIQVNKFIISRIKKLILATVESLGRYVKSTGNVPRDFEVGFKVNHKDVTIEGKIDRVDFLSDEQESYYSVIDYKSSPKKFDPTLFGNGIDIQLIVYSVAAKRIFDENNMPSGLYYSNLARPIVDYDKKYFEENNKGEFVLVQSVLDEELDKKNKMLGMICGNEDIYDDGKVIEKKMVGRGQLKALEDYALDLISRTHERIVGGEIELNPYRYGHEENACEYCEYSSICGFDEGNDRYRKLKKYTIDELTKDYMEE